MPSGFLGRGVGPKAFGGGGGRWYTAGGAPLPVAIYQPKGAASLAASYINIANPGTYDAAAGTAPTFDTATGWTFDATQSLEVALTPATDQTWSMIARFADVAGANKVVCGSFVAAGRGFILQAQNADSTARVIHNGDSMVIAGALAAGVIAVAGNKAYLDGVADAGVIGAWTGAAAAKITIGGYYDGAASVPLFGGGKIQAIAIYNATLTAPQVAAVSAAMAAL